MDSKTISIALGRSVSDQEIKEAGGIYGFSEKTEMPPAIAAAVEWGKELVRQSPPDKNAMTHPDRVFAHMRPLLEGKLQEELWVLLLDVQQQIISKEMVYKGTVDAATVRIAELLRPAVIAGAPKMVLVHNHPSGNPTPSPGDIRVTTRANTSAKMLEIELQDHVIVGKDHFISMKLAGLISEYDY